MIVNFSLLIKRFSYSDLMFVFKYEPSYQHHAMTGLKDISLWTPALREKLEAVYGRDQLTRLWTSYCEYFEHVLRDRDGEVCRTFLPQVKCPTLVMHGQLDPVVPVHHGRFVAENIPGAE